MMNQLIALLLPSIIGVKVYDKICGEEKTKRKIVERYLKCVLFINLIAYIVTIYVFKSPEFIFTNQFTVKYIILSVVIAKIFPIVEQFINENLNIEIKVEKNESKN